jgi:hypothetical protein
MRIPITPTSTRLLASRTPGRRGAKTDRRLRDRMLEALFELATLRVPILATPLADSTHVDRESREPEPLRGSVNAPA